MEPIIGTQAGNGPGAVIETSTAGFQADVLDASQKTPIVVDFWAPWCEPCKQLGPILEKAIGATNGRVRLVKVNIDENPDLAKTFRVQSIPMVYAFVDGRPADGFSGAQPESQIKAFVSRLVDKGGPSPVDEALEQAEAALAAGDFGTASAVFGQVLHHEPGNPDALAGLARCHLESGDTAGAREVLDQAGEDDAGHAGIKSVRAAIELAGQASEGAAEIAPLEARLAADANDHQARYDLAMALYAAGRREDAVESLLEIVRRDLAWNDEEARKQLVSFFEAFGPTDPLTLSARRQLSSILFS